MNEESSNEFRRSTKTFDSRTNERFLDESDDQQDHFNNNNDQDSNVVKIRRERNVDECHFCIF
ncbi:hypothetical protein BLA29_003552 [Euroglyphus maynei]|uniref:Uncharacterized protein n=1 Tax=Euroglyphus maynei TaxID=6958 RepID=A0A1Y3BGF1_EURMA|nr:hypothetical protein BLA29_003552 [Euroglyphus maynei]